MVIDDADGLFASGDPSTTLVEDLILPQPGSDETILVSAGSSLDLAVYFPGVDAEGNPFDLYIVLLPYESSTGTGVTYVFFSTNHTIEPGSVMYRDMAGTVVANQGTPVGTVTADLRQAICFGADAMILTADGYRAAGGLSVGDLVMTQDRGLQPIRWIDKKTLSTHALARALKLRPVHITAGSLGDGLPRTDLTVSQQHRVMVSSRIAARMGGAAEVLVAAKHLVGLPGVSIRDDLAPVTYVHFALDDHGIVFANGIASESLYLGPQALTMMGQSARDELFAIFPALTEMSHFVQPARPFISGGKARSLVARHVANGKSFGVTNRVEI
ncbi:hemolysin-type calcium-binding region [Ketogulonicigenium robustum]|uniref:Hemolysin-type calcium-binding region n=2 Tax=Ketogulonicigenium robustum TaxID=92947 RepID=A0A1W6NYJ3_9RHOB|nr:hemolysin-type calcium-binding region [Ketogulonicigenium robustum]